MPDAVTFRLGQSGAFPAVEWRAPLPGAVAFPVVPYLPVGETKNPLELKTKVFADFTKAIKLGRKFREVVLGGNK